MPNALSLRDMKIVVLDDDPTGTQTVHGTDVYTDLDASSFISGFSDSRSLFYVLTNSRSFTAEYTAEVHRKIAQDVLAASRATGKPFFLISRGDSTLRGHYPLETQVLRQTLEADGALRIDGELIIPAFPEGGRVTVDNIHCVWEADKLIPCGETEFAKDKTFGYRNSHLGMWVEEKTQGAYPADGCTYITLEDLESGEAAVLEKLMQVRGFGKVIVNARDYRDLEKFTKALSQAMERGKYFIARSAAAFVRVAGGISQRPLLTSKELMGDRTGGGLVIAGSHVKKTTEQLAQLATLPDICCVECNQHLVIDDAQWNDEIKRVSGICDANIAAGVTTLVMTRRERLDLNTGDAEDELRIATKISDGLVSIVSSLANAPAFVVAKGGITSCDIGVKGLLIKRALVLGQILPGIPVWQPDGNSRFPGIPYIVFPGNVGGPDDLKKTIQILQGNGDVSHD